MNNKGFTLVELLATLVVLSIILGITVVSVNKSFNETKNKTEELFVKTLKDGLSIYLDDALLKKSKFDDTGCTITKTRNNNMEVKLYYVNKTLDDVINSTYKPLSQSDLVNPSNEGVSCGTPQNINVTIYRDDDFVYYYRIKREDISCLKNKEGNITNLSDEAIECLDKDKVN